MKRRLKVITTNIILLFVMTELIALFAIRVFNVTAPPKFVLGSPYTVDIDPDFGVWHLPNTSYRHLEPCFDHRYYFNDYGARDKNHPQQSTNRRVINIGDSFIEGYGVDTTHRLSNLLARETGRDVLNFGTSGSFGTTQMRLLYENKASQFDHNTVLVGLYPQNDFQEEDLKLGKKSRADRYRPYLIEKDSSFQLTYFVDSLNKSQWNPNGDNYKGTI